MSPTASWRWRYDAGGFDYRVTVYCAAEDTTVTWENCSIVLASGEMAIALDADYFDLDGSDGDRSHETSWIEKTSGFSCDETGKISGVHTFGLPCDFNDLLTIKCPTATPTITVDP